MNKICVALGCFSLIHFSCHKDHDSTTPAPHKPGLIISGTRVVIFKITEIYSKLSTIRRRIEVVNKRAGSLLGEVSITLGCNDPIDDLYKIIRKHPENFSGHLKIKAPHLLEYTKNIFKGKLVKVEKLLGEEPDMGKSLEAICPVYPNISFVASIIDGMNWLEYAYCVFDNRDCITRTTKICRDKLRK